MDGGVHVAVADDELGDIHPLAAGEALGRLGGLAIGVERDLHGRALVLAMAVGLLLGHLPHQQRQAAGRAERLHLAVGDAPFGQFSLGDIGQLGERNRHELGGDLLAADFQKKILGHIIGPLSKAGSRVFPAGPGIPGHTGGPGCGPGR